MIAFRFILAIATIIFSGISALILIFRNLRKFSWAELTAISFGIGCGVIALGMFFMSLAGIKFSVMSFLFFEAFLYAGGIYAFIKNKPLVFEKIKIPKPSLLDLVLISAIGFNIAYVFFAAAGLPFTGWDDWGHWGYKAKIFFLTGNIGPSIAKDFFHGGVFNPHYPLLVSLLESYIWFFLGVIHEPGAKLAGVLFYACMLGVFYCVLKRRLERTIALGFALVLSSIPIISQLAFSGYADIPMAFFITSAFLYIWLYLKDREPVYLLLGALLLGIGMWVKNEGLAQWLTLVVSLVLLRMLKKNVLTSGNILVLIVLPLAIFLPWLIYRFAHGLSGHFQYDPYAEVFSLLEPGRLWVVFRLFAEQIVDFNAWNLVWFLFIFCAVISWHKRNKEELLCMFFIVLQLLIFFAIDFSMPYQVRHMRFYLSHILSRTIAQIVPIAVFFIALFWRRQEGEGH